MNNFLVENYSLDQSGISQRFAGLLLYLYIIDVYLVSVRSFFGNLENCVYREFRHCFLVFGENLARQ